MRWAPFTFLLLFMVVSLGCSRKAPEAKPATPPKPGAVYSLNDGEGGFRVGKVIAMDEDVVFVHLFGNRWSSRPSAQTLKSIQASLPVGYSTETFAGMAPGLVKQDTVSAEEEETYIAWKKTNTAAF